MQNLEIKKEALLNEKDATIKMLTEKSQNTQEKLLYYAKMFSYDAGLLDLFNRIYTTLVVDPNYDWNAILIEKNNTFQIDVKDNIVDKMMDTPEAAENTPKSDEPIPGTPKDDVPVPV